MSLELDHVVLGVPDLDEGMAWFESLTGVRPVHGGAHEGAGTHNALVGLGPTTYLELLAVDPDQDVPSSASKALVASLDEPRPVGWVYRVGDRGACRDRLTAGGVDHVERSYTRRSPGGDVSWHVVVPRHRYGAAVPFFIDWGSAPNPASTCPSAGRLLGVEPVHPDPAGVELLLAAMGLDVRVKAAPRSSLLLRLSTPGGDIELGP